MKFRYILMAFTDTTFCVGSKIVADEVQTLLFGEILIAGGVTDLLWKDTRRMILVLTTNRSSSVNE